MPNAYAGKIAFIDLTTGEIRTEKIDDSLARDYIGGQGLGVRTLFERQPRGVDPLGPENILGFTTGPLTGTKTPTGGRYIAVCKSPLTGAWASYPEMKIDSFERYEYSGKGPLAAKASAYLQVGASAGVCLMPMMFFGNFPLVDFLNAATGWGADVAEMLETGKRLMTLRQAFNIREGIEADDVQLPKRMMGIPAQTDGPLADVTIDIETLSREFRQAMGWDPDTARPAGEALDRLGLAKLVRDEG